MKDRCAGIIIIIQLLQPWLPGENKRLKCSDFYAERKTGADLEQVDLCIVLLSASKHRFSTKFYHGVSKRNP